MYVNRGLGVGGPAMRFHCSREIATIELASKRLGSLEELDEAGDDGLLARA